MKYSELVFSWFQEFYRIVKLSNSRIGGFSIDDSEIDSVSLFLALDSVI